MINPFPSEGNQKSLTYSRVFHLSHVIDPNIPRWPGDPPVEFETVAELKSDGYYLRRFSLGEHSATHMNAPNSFYKLGMGIDQYPSESLVVPAVVIDIRDKAVINPDYALTEAKLEKMGGGFLGESLKPLDLSMGTSLPPFFCRQIGHYR